MAAAAGDAARCRHRDPGGRGQRKPGEVQEIAVRHGLARLAGTFAWCRAGSGRCAGGST
ncbi:hypothetical protein [Streptomyces europaeiscabiei]|uniref:hypothetical protein n=1 Tax=Streptomyces europaeiscabiei TaxID=146819 RepID=UPI002E129F7D|nr:hypothetical protein OHB30_20155 [Streptomyces europaeiscabiei]